MFGIAEVTHLDQWPLAVIQQRIFLQYTHAAHLHAAAVSGKAHPSAS